uniref:Uncharacterized protein n=1 Tax=Tanacetum cinerariifolium TaxID=118510 RepID=A0A6L2L8B6_TANCI|nr:hypothetical protein [Tanacetum cinerariifolium]
MMDYALWEVIENGATWTKTQVVDGVTTVMPITTAKEKAQRRLEVKARSTLMIGILNEHQLMFNSIKDAKKLLEAVKKRRFLKKTRRKLTVNGNETLGFDMSKVEYYNCYKRGHFAKECRPLRNQDFKHKDSTRRSLHVKTPASTALVSCDDIAIKELRRKLKVAQKKDGIQLKVEKFKNVSKTLNKLIDCRIVNNCKKGLGYESYNAVSPPYTGNFFPSKPDLSFTGLDEFANKPIAENTKSSEEETKAVMKNFDAPIIKERVSDDEEDNVAQPKIVKKIVKPSISKKECVKHRQQEKTVRKTVKKVKHNKENTHKPRGNQRN